MTGILVKSPHPPHNLTPQTRLIFAHPGGGGGAGSGGGVSGGGGGGGSMGVHAVNGFGPCSYSAAGTMLTRANPQGKETLTEGEGERYRVPV